MAIKKPNIRSIYIKLGSACNLHCKYCHIESTNCKFNPKILPVLKEMGLAQVSFGGGEPLLYWDTIKEIVTYLGKGIRYRMVTNGTLFTPEIVDFCNEYNFVTFISLDGIHSTRDNSKPIQWDLIKKLTFAGTAVTFYRENQDIRKTLESLHDIKDKYLSISPQIYSSFPNFVHSTDKTGVLSDKALADSYVTQMSELLEESFAIYKAKGVAVVFLKRCFDEFMRVKRMNGVYCCNDRTIAILADGTICLCPYTLDNVGDIFHLDNIDWQHIERDYRRPQCKECELFTICGNRCCKDITDNLCYITRKMHSKMKELMELHHLSYEELDKVCVNKR